VFGSYAFNLPFSAFELSARSAISNDIASLPGRRFVTAIETDESARLNEARIKALTGGDPITARLLYREFITFKPVAKFWLAFNRCPIVADDSHGFWRRVHLIPFARQFDPHADPKLEEVLRSEAPGIMAWAVRGCLDWQANGLNPPCAVLKATQAYREDSDPLKHFLSERCILEPDARVVVADLWQAYLYWILETGDTALQRTEFGRRLESVGCRKVRSGHDRDWTWLGIRLKHDLEPERAVADADARTEADVKLQ
jgi:putative DNA primase/helicase